MIRGELEIGRRLVHSLGLVFPVTYFITDEWVHVQFLLLIALIVGFILEYLRLYRGYDNFIYDRLTRSYEDEKFAGYYLYIIGMFVVSILFNPLIAVSSMIILAIGDPIGGVLSDASVEDGKRLVAVVSVFLFSVVVIFFVISLSSTTRESIIVALIGGFVAALADYKKLIINNYIVDDNLVIPVSTGLVMQTAFYLIQYL